MKTLSDFKRQVSNYEFSLISNSLYATVPEFQSSWRPVASQNTVGFTLKTTRNGEVSESFLDWPMASELTFKGSKMTIKRIFPAHAGQLEPKETSHTMIYELRLAA